MHLLYLCINKNTVVHCLFMLVHTLCTLQRLLDLAGLHCTTSERSGPSLHSIQHNFLSRPLSFQDWTTVMRFHSLFLFGGMNFPPPSGMLDPWSFSSDTWKLISFFITWLHLKKKTKTSLSFLNFALFPLTSHYLARIFSEQCLEMCITSTSFVCLPLYIVSVIVFLNCKSLWIKASAKWINVNLPMLNNTTCVFLINALVNPEIKIN